MTIHYSDLDTASQEQLEEAWREWEAHPATAANSFFPGFPDGRISAVLDLAQFARRKRLAVKCRLDGHIDRAMILEDQCEGIYDQLPDYARW